MLTPSAQASSPTGNDITVIEVGGNATAGTVAVGGAFKSGTATFNALGFTTSCSGGTVAGNVNRGPFASGGTAFSFGTLSLNCPTPLGINATIALNAGCLVNMSMGNVKQSPLNDNVHAGLIDSGKWAGSTPKPKLHNVLGRAAIASKCVTMTMSGSSCTARADGNVAIEFDEAIKTVSGVNYQELILKGPGLTLRNRPWPASASWPGASRSTGSRSASPPSRPGPSTFDDPPAPGAVGAVDRDLAGSSP